MAEPPHSASQAGFPLLLPGEPAVPPQGQGAGGTAPGRPGTDSRRHDARRPHRRRSRLRRLLGVDPPRMERAPTRRGGPALTADPLSQELLPALLSSLALRDLTLVESLLRLIEEMEEHEEDPERLQSLFRIDHLATRMRRNGENLLVLAGQDTGQQRYEPVNLLDVVRAGISEITDYERAAVASLPGVRVAGLAADDVSHLLAELLENATSKSANQHQVTVSGRLNDDGSLILAVEDNGIGIPEERLADLNERLDSSPVLDMAAARHMGLYVVGRLSHRHGLRVQLRARPFGGTVAYVGLPSRLVHGLAESEPEQSWPADAPEGAAGPAADPLVPRPATERTSAGLPKRTRGANVPQRPDGGPPDDAPSGPAGGGSLAERLRDELSGFEAGQRAALRDAAGPALERRKAAGDGGAGESGQP
ncbi:MAG: sensor histidine kinase [Carbonactinosporaceae bacterium]